MGSMTGRLVCDYSRVSWLFPWHATMHSGTLSHTHTGTRSNPDPDPGPGPHSLSGTVSTLDSRLSLYSQVAVPLLCPPSTPHPVVRRPTSPPRHPSLHTLRARWVVVNNTTPVDIQSLFIQRHTPNWLQLTGQACISFECKLPRRQNLPILFSTFL